MLEPQMNERPCLRMHCAGLALLAAFCAQSAGAQENSRASAFATSPLNRPSARIEDCGLASVYCALVELGIPVELESLIERFESIHGNSDLSSLSIQELVDVLKLYHVPATAVRFDAADIDQVPIPTILYTAPRFRSSFLGTGHFAVLVDVTDEFATIVDLSLVGEGREDGAVQVHKGRLRSVWKGEAILLSAQPSAVSRLFENRNLAASALVLLLISAVLCVSTIRKMSKNGKHA